MYTAHSASSALRTASILRAQTSGSGTAPFSAFVSEKRTGGSVYHSVPDMQEICCCEITNLLEVWALSGAQVCILYRKFSPTVVYVRYKRVQCAYVVSWEHPERRPCAGGGSLGQLHPGLDANAAAINPASIRVLGRHKAPRDRVLAGMDTT